MARTLKINSSEWGFILAWLQICRYLKIVPSIYEIFAGDILYQTWISVDPAYIPSHCKRYRRMMRIVQMTPKCSNPPISVGATLKGIQLEYETPVPNEDCNFWFVDSIHFEFGNFTYDFQYTDIGNIQPGIYWMPDEAELWDVRRHRYCFRDNVPQPKPEAFE